MQNNKLQDWPNLDSCTSQAQLEMNNGPERPQKPLQMYLNKIDFKSLKEKYGKRELKIKRVRQQQKINKDVQKIGKYYYKVDPI